MVEEGGQKDETRTQTNTTLDVEPRLEQDIDEEDKVESDDESEQFNPRKRKQSDEMNLRKASELTNTLNEKGYWKHGPVPVNTNQRLSRPTTSRFGRERGPILKQT